MKMSGWMTRAVLVSVLCISASAPGGTEIVVIEGDPAPDGNGAFESFSAPILNASGDAAVQASGVEFVLAWL